MHDKTIIGIAWFDQMQWQLHTGVVPDRNELDDTFQDWERSALSTVRTHFLIRNNGYEIRVPRVQDDDA